LRGETAADGPLRTGATKDAVERFGARRQELLDEVEPGSRGETDADGPSRTGATKDAVERFGAQRHKTTKGAAFASPCLVRVKASYFFFAAFFFPPFFLVAMSLFSLSTFRGCGPLKKPQLMNV